MDSRLREIYERRFRDNQVYRSAVWRKLVRRVFQPLVPLDSAVLDLGCGYGDFVNNISAAKRYAMDLNPSVRGRLAGEVKFLEQDCSQEWAIPSGSIDVVFSSNFFEHLPSKCSLQLTLEQAYKALREGGVLICLGPNIRCVPGAYWDFIDHNIALSDHSAAEALELAGFVPKRIVDRFLPYTMSDGKRPPPLAFVDIYLSLPFLWPIMGKQFLIVAERPQLQNHAPPAPAVSGARPGSRLRAQVDQLDSGARM